MDMHDCGALRPSESTPLSDQDEDAVHAGPFRVLNSRHPSGQRMHTCSLGARCGPHT